MTSNRVTVSFSATLPILGLGFQDLASTRRSREAPLTCANVPLITPCVPASSTLALGDEAVFFVRQNTLRRHP